MTVIHLVSQASVEAAWGAYCAIALQVVESPSLLADADFNQRLAGAWAKWRDLFLRMEG